MPRSTHMIRLAGLLMMVLATALAPAIAVAQDGHAPMGRDGERGEVSLVDQFAELRAKVARLEAALERNHRQHADHREGMMQGGMGMGMDGGGMGEGGMSPMGGGMKGMKSGGGMSRGMGMQRMGSDGGMGGMGRGDMQRMQGGGMGGGMAMPNDGSGGGGMGMGMGMMGSMKGMSGGMAGDVSGASGGSGMAMNSALPGFAGASHLYHTGATGFFLDHGEHIGLTTEQVASLNRIREKNLLARNTAGREIEQTEQELWELTAADEPDAKLIEEKVREIERLRGDQRLSFIRAVGEAAQVLTAEQRQTLLGMESGGASAQTQPASDAPDTSDTPDTSDHQQHQP